MKQVKVCLGRFQPFTLGHLKMATYKDLKGPDKEQQDKLREQPDLKEIAKQKTIILSILTTNDKVDTRHPFDADLMKDELELLTKNYSSDIEDIMYVKSADICAWGEMLKQKGYQASVWLTGSDEFNMYKGMAVKVPEYEEHNRNNYDCKDAYTKSFYVENIERTDDGDFVSSISGTKVRQALLNGDKELFTKMMPKGADKYFDKFKEAIENAPEPAKKPTKKKIKEGMKSLKEYILESKINQINEKLSFGDKIDYFIFTKIFKQDWVTQEQYIKRVKKVVEENSDNKVSIILKKYKDIKKDLSNCLNKDEELSSHDWGTFNIEKGIKEAHWWNDIKLEDDFPFMCYYNRSNKDKYVLEPDSLWFLKQKNAKGNRALMGGLSLDTEDERSFGWLIKNYRIPQTLDYVKWEEERNKKDAEFKKKEQESIKASIKRMEDELNKLKELVKNEDN